jgi:hypothetical protein
VALTLFILFLIAACYLGLIVVTVSSFRQLNNFIRHEQRRKGHH